MVTSRRAGMFNTSQFMHCCFYYCICYYTRDADSCSRLHHHWNRDLASSMPCLRATLAHRIGVAHGLHGQKCSFQFMLGMFMKCRLHLVAVLLFCQKGQRSWN